MRYDFEDQKQLGDWREEEGPDRLRENAPPLKRESSFLECKNGVLRAAGQVSRRHVLEFEGPQELRWSEITKAVTGTRSDYLLYHQVALCHDPNGSYASVINSISLQAAFEISSTACLNVN